MSTRRDLGAFKRGDRVHDRWWPWRLGVVARVFKTRVRVLWTDARDGERPWSYDRAHLRFLAQDRGPTARWHRRHRGGSP